MDTQLIYNKAGRIRDVLRYVSLFKNSLIVIHIDEDIINSTLFSSHIHDIAYLHESGIKIVIVPGAKRSIDSTLRMANIPWHYADDTRITDLSAIPLIKMAAFDVSNKIMTYLAEENLSAVIGNWVKARGKGVLNGIDFCTAGEIASIDSNALNTVLDEGFIPIFPCIGWSSTGRPYNISSASLATEIAIKLNAKKLFFMSPYDNLSDKDFLLPDDVLGEDFIPSLNLDQLKSLLKLNSKNETEKRSLLSLLKLSDLACQNGVERCHIVNGFIDGSLPCEIFSDIGTGTMIYKDSYGGIRKITKSDIAPILNLMRPFIEKQILLPRTEQNILDRIDDFIVYELDGGIKACSALHILDDTSAEIAAVAVDHSCSNIGIGPKMISYLIEKAKAMKLSKVFILTTQTADWFEKLGFIQTDLSELPKCKQEKYDRKRLSKIFVYNIQ
ncbi:MAG: amino-acid N-acetyltransferase [Treponemataceae bacterium]|nr:amino-acid N-acetyltransferase [Treponemataceae bacterium]